MNVWSIERAEPRRSAPSLDISRAAGLMAAIGSHRQDAFAAEVVRTVSAFVPVAQCTVYAYDAERRPRAVSIADGRDGRELGTISALYTRYFYPMDGNQQVMGVESRRTGGPRLVVHRQARDDISHPAYRENCYARPDVRERIAILSGADACSWLSVNLYRSTQQGNFQPGELEVIGELAPLLADAARHHSRIVDASRHLPALLLRRLHAACPDLSKRELDVIRGMLEGLSSPQIAEVMGVRLSSVTTYQKRAYRRLGISGVRELFALCMAAEGGG